MFLPEVDLVAGTVTFGVWQAALCAGVLLFLLLAAMLYRGDWANAASYASGPVLRVVLVLFAVLAGWTLLERSAQSDRANAQRSLDQRILELGARALASGSSLGCFEAQLSPAVEGACEQAVFSGPESVAAASAYVAANFSLLWDATAKGFDFDDDPVLAALRGKLERDRFGFVAQVLAARGCSAAQCEEFALFTDTSRIIANLKSRAFETIVARHAPGWPQPAPGTAPSAQASPPAAVAAAPPASNPAPSGGSSINFPSAASIPPVSIMTEEPSGQNATAAGASNGAPKRISPPPRAPAHAQSAPAAQPPAAGAPIQIAPPAASAGTEPTVQ